MKNVLLRFLLVCGLLISGICWAQQAPAAPSRWVTDTAGVLSPSTASRLDEELASYESQTGHQVLVWIGKSTNGEPIETWTERAFTAWKVGRKKFDDGLVLFVMTSDRTARIEVGYGLEGRFPDATASEVINGTLIPAMKAGDADKGVAGSVDEVLNRLGGGSGTIVSPDGEVQLQPYQIILMVLVGIALLILVIRHPVLGYYLIAMLSNSYRGKGGFGRGGGGGRTGGGGASGRW